MYVMYLPTILDMQLNRFDLVLKHFGKFKGDFTIRLWCVWPHLDQAVLLKGDVAYKEAQR